MPMLPSQQNPSPVDLQETKICDTRLVPAIFTPVADVLLTYIEPKAGEYVMDDAGGTSVASRHAAAWVGTKASVTSLDINSAIVTVPRHMPPSPGAPIVGLAGNAYALPLDRVFWLSRGIATPFRGVWISEDVGPYQLNAQFCEVRIP